MSIFVKKSPSSDWESQRYAKHKTKTLLHSDPNNETPRENLVRSTGDDKGTMRGRRRREVLTLLQNHEKHY